MSRILAQFSMHGILLAASSVDPMKLDVSEEGKMRHAQVLDLMLKSAREYPVTVGETEFLMVQMVMPVAALQKLELEYPSETLGTN